MLLSYTLMDLITIWLVFFKIQDKSIGWVT